MNASPYSSASIQGQARPLLWWNTRQLAGLEALLDTARRRWLNAWIDNYRHDDIALPPIRCRAAPAHDRQLAAEPVWQLLCESSGVPEDDRVWIDARQAEERMAQLLLRPASPAALSAKNSTLAAELATEALADSIAEILSALDTPPDDAFANARARGHAGVLPADQHRLWSGAVIADFPLGDDWSLHLHIAAGRVAALVKDAPDTGSARVAPPPVMLTEALAERPVRMRVELAPVELSIGDLQSLSAGDVLIVPHPLTQMLQVRTEQGRLLCGACLGQTQGRRAIGLIRSDAAS